MRKQLTTQTIKERMADWRNTKKLHTAAREQVEKQKQTIKELREENATLKKDARTRDEEIEKLKLRIEELERMIFRSVKKRTVSDYTEVLADPRHAKKNSRKTHRSSASYHRRIPAADEVTSHEYHSVDVCNDCHDTLENIETKDFYHEDIILPDKLTKLITIIKHTVERGYCKNGKKWTSAILIPTTPVVIGEKTRAFVSYSSIILRLSYEQIQNLLHNLYQLPLSQGEVTNILTTEAKELRPAYEDLKTRIQNEDAAHYDETSWPVQQGKHGNYAWVMIAARTMDAVFEIGKSRGRGIAEKLKGVAKHTGITDAYSAYLNLLRLHALCWAHPFRKLRDLAKSRTYTKKHHERAVIVYQEFGTLYAKIERTLSNPFDITTRKRAATRLGREFDIVAAPHGDDPIAVAKNQGTSS